VAREKALGKITMGKVLLKIDFIPIGLAKRANVKRTNA
jgi:hypothetical protein